MNCMLFNGLGEWQAKYWTTFNIVLVTRRLFQCIIAQILDVTSRLHKTPPSHSFAISKQLLIPVIFFSLPALSLCTACTKPYIPAIPPQLSNFLFFGHWPILFPIPRITAHFHCFKHFLCFNASSDSTFLRRPFLLMLYTFYIPSCPCTCNFPKQQ